MENQEFQLGTYLTNGVENIVKGAVRATLTDPRESAFMARFALASKEASRRRAQAEKGGENIPPFLIASITSACNLHCAGCYSRQNHACVDAEPVDQLPGEDWKNIFAEAKQLGISFILLAGGEPLLRWDVIEAAGEYPDILFPVFTNGTLLNDEYIRLFDKKRNLMPDVRRHHHQLRLLFPDGAMGKEKAHGRHADDAQNHGLYLDDLHGAGGIVMKKRSKLVFLLLHDNSASFTLRAKNTVCYTWQHMINAGSTSRSRGKEECNEAPRTLYSQGYDRRCALEAHHGICRAHAHRQPGPAAL